MIRYLTLSAFLLSGLLLNAQESVPADGDSTVVLTIEQLYEHVFAYHPIIRQSTLLEEEARQQVRYARGFFDPGITASWEKKRLGDTEYFDVLESELKIPLWFPLDPKVSVDRASGDRLNPEQYIPPGDDYLQVKTGVSLPIGQGLFIDARRATLRQAKLIPDMLEAERRKIINDVMRDITKDYWSWYYAWNKYDLLSSSVGISREILDRTRLNFQLGEAARIDTVQARINLQNRLIQQSEAYIELQQARLQLSNHLWNEEGIPLEIPENMIPQQAALSDRLTEIQILDTLRAFAMQQHPDIVMYERTIAGIEIEEQYNREMLKPKIDLSYQLINQPFAPSGELTSISPGENYLMGVDFGFPLFIRKERAKLKLTQLKKMETQFALDFRRNSIRNNIQASYIELVNSVTLLDQQQEAARNYRILLDAELLNLEEGESDLFRINFQQDKLIEARTKLFKIRSEYEKSRADLLWSAGTHEREF